MTAKFLAAAPLWLSLWPAFALDWLPWWYAFALVPGAVLTCRFAEMIGETHCNDRQD